SYNLQDQERCVRLAVGLTRRQLESIAAECRFTKDKELTAAHLDARRKELLGRDFNDLLEFYEPEWTLDDVGGAAEAKAELMDLAAMLKSGDRDIPAGYIVGGQNGVGKTYLLKGFAGTAGITVIILKPFKASGYGESERNWDRIATALKSAGQVIVIVQEADGMLGQRTGQNVHETSKAVLMQQLALMGDPAYRGKILWMLDTCRPDKLAPDVKRPGRCERIIPLFPETTEAGVQAILEAQVRLLTRKDGYTFEEAFFTRLDTRVTMNLVRKTGAQIERVLRRARKQMRQEGAPAITVKHVRHVLATDTIRAEPEAYELQRLIAMNEAIEHENADLIPPLYLTQMQDGGGIGPLKERIEVLRRRCDAV
ncbi:MAG: ATP-binding protein, partial [bacterium]|nr:ATP-binding protein [bacterium]